MIDNDVYNRMADSWWSENGFLNLLQSAINPWRVPYFKRIIAQRGIEPRGKRALEVGCGGGLLTEEIAALGFSVSGVDVSEPSLKVARAHAARDETQIDYELARGEQLPFAEESFEIAFCCDTLEHIENWSAAIAELARILKRGGVLFYDTINRTFASQVRSVWMAQEWRWTRYAPRNTHVWDMFIQPAELTDCLARHGLENQDLVGTAPKGNPLQALWLTRQYKAGKISSTELGRKIQMQEGNILSGSYMGYAIKR